VERLVAGELWVSLVDMWLDLSNDRSGNPMSGPMSVYPRRDEVTETELRREGFSEEAIGQLRGMREMYPYVEYVDSRREWHRLRFVKWLYHQGQITR
jgi:hypothetical protein